MTPTIEEVKEVADVCGARQCRDMVKFTNEQLQAFAQHFMDKQRESDAKLCVNPFMLNHDAAGTARNLAQAISNNTGE